MGSTIKTSSSELQDSPPKNNIHAEPTIKGSNSQKKRIVDAVVSVRDANESVINPNLTQGIGRILTETDLFDLHFHRHPQHP